MYVSVWYCVAGLLWIAVLYVVAKLPGVHIGVQQATTNWRFVYNALGLWFTPVAVCASTTSCLRSSPAVVIAALFVEVMLGTPFERLTSRSLPWQCSLW